MQSQTTDTNQTGTPAPQTKGNPLPWTKCWRKAYAEAAKALGYECSWGGRLIIRKPGEWYAFVTPKTNPFHMEDLIQQAFEAAQDQIKAKAKKAAEKEERISLLLSRAASGEAIFLKEKAASAPYRNRMSSLAAMALALSGLNMDHIGSNWGMPSRRRRF